MRVRVRVRVCVPKIYLIDITNTRCNIPVVIMGETGCGKTRLIRYMCDLQAFGSGRQNMLMMKVRVVYHLL